MSKTVIIGNPGGQLVTSAAMSLLLSMQNKGQQIRSAIDKHEDEFRALWANPTSLVSDFYDLAVKMGFEQDQAAFGRAWHCYRVQDENFTIAKEEFFCILYGWW